MSGYDTGGGPEVRGRRRAGLGYELDERRRRRRRRRLRLRRRGELSLSLSLPAERAAGWVALKYAMRPPVVVYGVNLAHGAEIKVRDA